MSVPPPTYEDLKAQIITLRTDLSKTQLAHLDDIAKIRAAQKLMLTTRLFSVVYHKHPWANQAVHDAGQAVMEASDNMEVTLV